MKHKILIAFVGVLMFCSTYRSYASNNNYEGFVFYSTFYYKIIDATQHYVSVIDPSNSGGYYYGYMSGNITIPDSVTYDNIIYAVKVIDNNAFRACTGLDSVIIPNSVISIGDYAFYNCTGLSFVSATNSLTSIGNHAFHNCSSLAGFVIPDSVVFLGEFAFCNCNSLANVLIPNGLSTINKYLFAGCSSITSIIIPNNVDSIYNSAFQSCTGVTSLVISESVTFIGINAFYGCIGLSSISIPNSVTTISQEAFSNCSGLTSIVIPNSVVSIGNYAFADCSGLISVSLPDSITAIGWYVFKGCSGLTDIVLPESITSIGWYAFKDCVGLTSVTIPANVSEIGAYAFDGCTNLNSIYCYPIVPPTLGLGVFPSIYIPLYVPCAAVLTYQNAPNWSSHYASTYGMPDLEYTYNIESNNEIFGIVNVGDVNCDSNITITATANTGYQLIGWSDGGEGNPRTLHITSDTTVTAIFDLATYIIVGLSNNAARGFVSGGDTVYYGDTIILEAIPNYGYHFTRWNDNDTQNPRTIIVTQNKTYTAYFTPNTYTVTVHSADSTQGTVSGSGTVNYSTNRTIHAYPITGYHFSHWSDGDSNATRIINVTKDSVLIAYFEINTYQLIVLPNDSTLGNVTGSGLFTHGSLVTVTATPNPGNRLDRWSDNSLLSNYSFTLTNNLQLVAVFVPSDTVFIHDTSYVEIINTVHDTTYIDIHDTTYITLHDTTVITIIDTMVVETFVYDTMYISIHDTVYDTIYIHDTIYNGVDDVEIINIKLYSRDGNIIVEGAGNDLVILYDVNGRMLATKRDNTETLFFDVPTSGVYMIKVGNYPARKVVVIKS